MSSFRYPPHGISGVTRRKLIQYGALAVGSGFVAACAPRSAEQSESTERSVSAANSPGTSSPTELVKVTYGTNWYAQAEHGGFYQAVATGIYEDYGLDVTIQMGGPQVNGTQLLMGGAIDFFMGYGSDAIKAIEEGIPKVTVAAIFQKDPQVIMAHPGTADSLEDLKGRPIFISTAANVTYWPFLKARYGFTDDQKRTYNFNSGPFLADKNSAQQGYLSSEPLAISKEGGFEPVVFLLADFGYNPYSTTIECKRELVEQNPDLVQRFVDASIKGWYSYLDGDPTPANELIKQDNPEMTDEQLAYSIDRIKEYGIAVSGDAETQGIGAMTDDRWQSFFETMVEQGIFKPETDYTQAYTLQFVNKGVDAYRT